MHSVYMSNECICNIRASRCCNCRVLSKDRVLFVTTDADCTTYRFNDIPRETSEEHISNAGRLSCFSCGLNSLLKTPLSSSKKTYVSSERDFLGPYTSSHRLSEQP